MSDELFPGVRMDLSPPPRQAEEETDRKGKPDPFHYQKLAEAFLIDSGETYRHYMGKTLRYFQGRYVEDHHLATRLRTFLHARKVPTNNNLIGNVLPIIHAMTFCDPFVYKDMPFWFGNAPAVGTNLVTYENGILDVDRAILGDHSLTPLTPKWINLVKLPYAYDPGQPCPLWLAFLDLALEGDRDRIALLQEWFGYCLLPDNSRQKIFVQQGPPRAGKGTIQRVLTTVLGEDNVTGYSLLNLAGRFGFGSLVGKLVACVGEVNLAKNQDKYEILTNLNMISGGDPVEVEYKHVAVKFSMVLPVRFFLSCNRFPNFADTSGAIAERLLVLPFERAIPEADRDPLLADRLATEVAGINNWAIAGLARLRSQGFTTPAKSLDSLDTIRRSTSVVSGFIQDRLAVSRRLDTGNLPGVLMVNDDDLTVDVRTLAMAYEEWCGLNDHDFIPQYLVSNLRVVLPKLARPRQQADHRRTHPPLPRWHQGPLNCNRVVTGSTYCLPMN